jgi:hypothetical protein
MAQDRRATGDGGGFHVDLSGKEKAARRRPAFGLIDASGVKRE